MISQWEYRLFSQQPSPLAGFFRPPLRILKILNIFLPSILKKLSLKLAILLLIPALSIWGWEGLENQTQNCVHVKHILYNWDTPPILELIFYFETVQDPPGSKRLKWIFQLFHCGWFPPIDGWEKPFLVMWAGKPFHQVEKLAASFLTLVHHHLPETGPFL